MKLGLLMTTLCIGSLAFADPAITAVTAKQRYPWNGKVDISYAVSGIEAAAKQKGWITSLKVTAKDNDASTTYTALSLTGDTSLADGTHAIIWDMSAQGLTFKSTNVTFNVTCETKDALYCVIDLSGGSTASSYPVSYMNEIPGGSWSDEYKTTKLVLRRMATGSCVRFTSGDGKSTGTIVIDQPYYIGVFEVTQKQWALVMGGAVGNSTSPKSNVSFNDIRGASNGASWPSSAEVDGTSFVGKLRTRIGLELDLPTIDQWRYAYRAGTSTLFYWGGGVNGSYLWYYDNSSSSVHAVGEKISNGWGLYDMSGNVAEWCLDWDSYYGTYRSVCGGGYNSGWGACTSSNVNSKTPLSSSGDCGLRLISRIK